MRDSFDFDSVPLPDGGFYHSDGDAKGTMMIGFGRARRNKWVQLSQAEIGAFLSNGVEMYRTDDPVLKGLLADVAAAIAGSKPRWADLNALLAQVTAGDAAAQAAAADVMAMVNGGMPVEDAVADANRKYAHGIPDKPKPDAKVVRAVPRAG